jgi:hypothetical protein
MKRLIVYGLVMFFLTVTASIASAIEYATDHLEKGNPGGAAASLKSFDQKGVKDAGKEMSVDVWVKDAPEELITAGFWLSHDAAKVKIVKIDIYDGTALPGPWDSAMSRVVANPGGPGAYMVIVGNLGTVKPDKKGDIIIARIQCSCQDKCTNPMEIKPIQDFDTVVGGNGKVYDALIKPAAFTIHEK